MSCRNYSTLHLICFPVLLLLIAASAYAQSGGGPRGYVCHRTSKPIVIDGKLDDPAWQLGAWTDEFVDIEGSIRPLPRYRTRVKMLWDDLYFYVGAELTEPHVWATLTKRDTVIFYDNDFEIFIDPDGDNHEYYELEMNALNTCWDLLLVKPYRDGGPPVDSWDIKGLKTAVHIDGTLNDPRDRDSGWTIEMALPWSALKEYAHRPSPPGEGDHWRVNFSRVEWDLEVVDGKYQKIKGRPENNWVWSPQGVIDMHRPELWGYVQFTEATEGNVQFEPDPAMPARTLLMQIYYAQKQYFEKRNRWAFSLNELEMKALPAEQRVYAPALQATDNGFIATVTITLRSGKAQRWHVRQDSRLWSD